LAEASVPRQQSIAYSQTAIILIGLIICAIKAYQGKAFKLPIIGNMAEKFAGGSA